MLVDNSRFIHKNPPKRVFRKLFCVSRKQLTFGELRTTTCFTQTDFLTFNLTSVTSNEASFTQFGTQGLVVLHQSAGDTVTDRTSLTRDTTTFNSDVQIQFLNHVDQFQRLTNYHAGSFTTEVLFQRTLVDNDFTVARFDENASCGTLRRPVP